MKSKILKEIYFIEESTRDREEVLNKCLVDRLNKTYKNIEINNKNRIPVLDKLFNKMQTSNIVNFAEKISERDKRTSTILIKGIYSAVFRNLER